VEVLPDRTLVVHIHANPAAEQQLVDRLMRLPSVAASNIRVSVHLAQ
jgi:hypothetical protein